MKNNKVINMSRAEIYYDVAAQFMDTDICEYLHNRLAPCTNQEFFTAYEKAHFEKYGETWFLSEDNPIY